MKRKSILLALLIGIALLALTACGGASKALDGTSWTLVSFGTNTPIEGTTVTVKFADGEISGSTGCNQYGGTYEENGDSLTLSEMFMTEMACVEPDGVMTQESVYLQMLGGAESFVLSDGQLQIITIDGDVLTFTADS